MDIINDEIYQRDDEMGNIYGEMVERFDRISEMYDEMVYISMMKYG